jgi:hypothetical protein
MDIPDLVRERLGDEEITAGVSIGDEDAVCLTPTRTLIYRSEGLLSDQRVEEYSHDAERVAVKEGRRKTKFLLEYVEGTESFTVPANRGEKVLELLLEGVLRLDGVIGERESIAGVYRFTELTLIVAEGRLLKHIGSHVWDDDFEAYPFEDVTGLEFERASNATSIAVSIGGRPQRVKVPNDTARVVQQTIEDVLFDYYDVASLDELNGVVGREDDDGVDDVTDRSDDIGFEAGIDPLVTDTEDEADEEKLERKLEDAAGGESGARPERMDVSIGERDAGDDASGSDTVADATSGTDAADESVGRSTDETRASEATDDVATSETRTDDPATNAEEWTSPGTTGSASTVESEDSTQEAAEASADATSERATTTDRAPSGERAAESPQTAGQSSKAESQPESTTQTSTPDTADSPGADDGRAGAASEAELEALTARVDQLTDAVERQNELLKRQHKAIKQLAREVRSE